MPGTHSYAETMRLSALIFMFLFLLPVMVSSAELSGSKKNDARRQVIDRAKEKADNGDPRLAGEIIKAGIRRFGGDDRLYFYLGLFQYKAGHAGEAVENLERSIQHLNIDSTPHYVLAKALWKDGRRYEALAELRRVLSMNNDHRGAILDTAHLLREMKEYESARLFYAIALHQQPGDTGAREGLLAMDELLGVSPATTVIYQKILKKNPGDLEVSNRLVRLLIHNHQYEQAMEAIRGMPADHPERDRFRLAIMRGLKRWDGVSKLAESVLEKEPDNVAAYAALVDSAIGEKRFVDAVKSGRRFLAVAPDNMQAMMLTAFAMTHTGEFQRARSLYQRACIHADAAARKEILRNIKFLDTVIKETGGDLK